MAPGGARRRGRPRPLSHTQTGRLEAELMNSEQTGRANTAKKRFEPTKASGEYRTLRISDRAKPGHWPGATYRDRAESELFRLCAALGYEGDYDGYNEVLSEMLGTWSQATVPSEAPYASEI